MEILEVYQHFPKTSILAYFSFHLISYGLTTTKLPWTKRNKRRRKRRATTLRMMMRKTVVFRKEMMQLRKRKKSFKTMGRLWKHPMRPMKN